MEEEKEVVEKRNDIKNKVQSLIGAIPYMDKSLSELRKERLRKYEIHCRYGETGRNI